MTRSNPTRRAKTSFVSRELVFNLHFVGKFAASAAMDIISYCVVNMRERERETDVEGGGVSE